MHTLRTLLRMLCLVLVMTATTSAYAAGMGRLTVLSALGQPLRAEITLTATPDELSTLNVRLASPEAFQQAKIEYVSMLASIQFSINKPPSGQVGQVSVRVTSDKPINEPFLDLLIQMDWAQGRLIREYTFLLDPAPEMLGINRGDPGFQNIALPFVAAPAVEEKPALAQVNDPIAPPSMASPSPQPAQTDIQSSNQKATQKDASALVRTHVVKQGETLNQVARVHPLQGVSLDQALVALFRENEAAFMGHNMHRLQRGAILNLPDETTAASINAREAKQFIVAQSADFNAYRQKLAAAVPSMPIAAAEPARQALKGKVGADISHRAPLPAMLQDKLKISRAEMHEENLITKDRALREANSRIAELEKNLQDLKKLAELKAQSIAHGTVVSPAKVVPTPVSTSVPTLKLDPVVIPAPAPVESGFVEEFLQSSLTIQGALVILIILIAYLGYRKYQRGQASAINEAENDTFNPFMDHNHVASENETEREDDGSDAPEDLVAEAVVSERALPVAPMPMEFDLSNISLELEPAKFAESNKSTEFAESIQSPEALESAVKEMNAQEQDSAVIDAQELAFTDDGNPVEQSISIKLELVKVYEEVGDLEGARELLQEILKNGDALQQEEARAALAKLG